MAEQGTPEEMPVYEAWIESVMESVLEHAFEEHTCHVVPLFEKHTVRQF